MLEEFVADVIVEGELLTLGATLSLKWELHQLIIGWSSSSELPRDVGSLPGEQPRACDPSRVSTSHLSLHPPHLIEGKEGQEGDELRLGGQSEVHRIREVQVSPHEEEHIPIGILSLQWDHLLDLDPALITVLGGVRTVP